MKPIAAVQGAEGAVIQRLLREFIERQPPSTRIVGVIEEAQTQARKSAVMRTITADHRFPVFQDLGAGARGCAIDASGITLASEAVLQEVAAGCDLVVLSKFGKLEADRGSGLLPVFSAALDVGIPVLTSVSPKFVEAWVRFADPFFVVLPASVEAIDAWWQRFAPDRNR